MELEVRSAAQEMLGELQEQLNSVSTELEEERGLGGQLLAALREIQARFASLPTTPRLAGPPEEPAAAGSGGGCTAEGLSLAQRLQLLMPAWEQQAAVGGEAASPRDETEGSAAQAAALALLQQKMQRALRERDAVLDRLAVVETRLREQQEQQAQQEAWEGAPGSPAGSSSSGDGASVSAREEPAVQGEGGAGEAQQKMAEVMRELSATLGRMGAAPQPVAAASPRGAIRGGASPTRAPSACAAAPDAAGLGTQLAELQAQAAALSDHAATAISAVQQQRQQLERERQRRRAAEGAARAVAAERRAAEDLADAALSEAESLHDLVQRLEGGGKRLRTGELWSKLLEAERLAASAMRGSPRWGDAGVAVGASQRLAEARRMLEGGEVADVHLDRDVTRQLALLRQRSTLLRENSRLLSLPVPPSPDRVGTAGAGGAEPQTAAADAASCSPVAQPPGVEATPAAALQAAATPAGQWLPPRPMGSAGGSRARLDIADRFASLVHSMDKRLAALAATRPLPSSLSGAHVTSPPSEAEAAAPAAGAVEPAVVLLPRAQDTAHTEQEPVLPWKAAQLERSVSLAERSVSPAEPGPATASLGTQTDAWDASAACLRVGAGVGVPAAAPGTSLFWWLPYLFPQILRLAFAFASGRAASPIQSLLLSRFAAALAALGSSMAGASLLLCAAAGRAAVRQRRTQTMRIDAP
eukprot:scaffold24.g2924.t1